MCLQVLFIYHRITTTVASVVSPSVLYIVKMIIQRKSGKEKLPWSRIHHLFILVKADSDYKKMKRTEEAEEPERDYMKEKFVPRTKLSAKPD